MFTLLIDLLKKLIIIILIVAGGYFFYKKFVAPTMNPFLNKHAGNVPYLEY